MPTYTNASEDTVYATNPFAVLPPGDTALDFYLGDLPTFITLKAHTPIISPWVLVEATNDIYQVSEYLNIAIYNASDDLASVSANTDDDNAYMVASLAKEVFSNDKRLFGCLEVLSKGTGTVYIYGLK